MAGPKRVSLYYPLRPGNGQRILRGIFRYAQQAGPWELCLTVGWDLHTLLPWNPDGVLAQVICAEAAAMIERLSIPVVDTSFDFPDLPVPRVGLDDQATGVLAAEHFLARGFTRFVYLGAQGRAYSARRWEGFQDRLRAAGHQPTHGPDLLGSDWQDVLPPVTQEARRWVLELARPTAAFAATDELALRLLKVARSAGVRVPEDLAVLGAGDVDALCDLADPPLSSIRSAAETTGYEAARLLDHLMAGGPPPPGRLEFPPLGVITRRSTDLLAVTDPELAVALRYIHDHAGRDIRVGDVADACSLSRSTLDRRFRAVLGRSVLEEIYRLRVERARRLLLETDWAMHRVAREAGFRDGRHLSEAFRARTGDTPTAYRRRSRCR